jgi:uncharacterized protein
MAADGTFKPWLDVLEGEWSGAVLDIHTHIGRNDPDGFRGTTEELVAALDLLEARGVVFPMHEPGGYRQANDEVIEAAKAHPRSLTPFCRVDPADVPVAEAELALDAGARGVKLHPRAEGFTLSHSGVASVLEVCEERRAPVLVHAGRGIPALGRDAVALAERFPRAPVILAHAGISDLAWIWRRADEETSLFFDTSWWGSADLLTLFTLLPPSRVLFGSDAPYGIPMAGAVATLRCALQAGLSREQLDGVMGRQAERLLSWEPPLATGPPVGTARLSSDVLLDRVHTYLNVAMGLLVRDRPADEQLALARLACEVGEGAPQAAVCRSVISLLDIRDRLAAEAGSGWVGAHHVAVGLVVAKTPDVPLPEPLPGVEVGERVPAGAGEAESS